MHIKCIRKDEENFPKNLLALKDCPKQIFAMGNDEILSHFSVAVVGARRCSALGERIAKEIAGDLSKKGAHIISGMAYGIDSASHRACFLENATGKTIGVLGCGIQHFYERERKELFEKIIETGGLIISEYENNERPEKYKFHNRNRIIASLSSGVVVVEAREKSGSLITANYAKELGKNIFVVPGNVYDENYARK